MFKRNILELLETVISLIHFGICFFHKGNPKLSFGIIEASGPESFSILFREGIIDDNIPPYPIDIDSDIVEAVGVDLLVLDELFDVLFLFGQDPQDGQKGG
jgi:hypothetical protein